MPQRQQHVENVVHWQPRPTQMSCHGVFWQTTKCVMRLADCRWGCGETVFVKEELAHFAVCTKRTVEVRQRCTYSLPLRCSHYRIALTRKHCTLAVMLTGSAVETAA